MLILLLSYWLVVAAVHAAVTRTAISTSTAPALVLVLVLVLDDSAIGDANGALDQGCLQAAVSLQQSI